MDWSPSVPAEATRLPPRVRCSSTPNSPRRTWPWKPCVSPVKFAFSRTRISPSKSSDAHRDCESGRNFLLQMLRACCRSVLHLLQALDLFCKPHVSMWHLLLGVRRLALNLRH